MNSAAARYAPARLWVRKAKDRLLSGLMALMALAAVGALALVLLYLLRNGLRALSLRIFLEGPTPMGTPGGGLRNAIAGTLVLMALASAIGLPLGILGGIYQIEVKGRFAWTVRFLTDVLNSIPSIVIGIFVYVVVVLPTARIHPGSGFSALAGGVALGIIMIPTIMRTTEEILRLIPLSLWEASLALGATRWRTMWSVVLPAARGGILTGIMLALARIAGETAPLLFTAFGNVDFNLKITKPIDALPLSIFTNATSPYDYLHQQAQAGAILLVLLILVLSVVTRVMLSRKMYEGR
ncbi:MAG TPA: phosphate ABC transporter permease PstA [Chthonomonadaceae bacterium]|nr:phosphate ABC transporter permease PstA [Chthonomonadaceae bacterium]